ncbi:MAG: ATP-binding cassette domain-containing protein [Bdellovibrionaceae bacterium]|nr:ATP-binding cassette domain-containing protein [Pseudobdellovibrionaceae bacterium]
MVVIKVKNLSKKFGGKTIHKNINFEVFQGECLGLLGGSGAGKSVILRSLIGLEKPDGGSIQIEGEEIVSKEEDQLIEIRKKVAYVFQNGALFDSMNVYDNLAYPLKEHTTLNHAEISKEIHKLLEEFGLEGTSEVYPSELSGGMQKRVGLARSIIIKPKIVLFDEPTAGLDPYNTIKIQETIIKLKQKGMTSIFVTHDMPTAFAVCDRLALVQEGKIACVDSVSEIKKDKSNRINQFISGIYI